MIEEHRNFFAINCISLLKDQRPITPYLHTMSSDSLVPETRVLAIASHVSLFVRFDSSFG
jgi:hypothetical protein